MVCFFIVAAIIVFEEVSLQINAECGIWLNYEIMFCTYLTLQLTNGYIISNLLIRYEACDKSLMQ